jgi:hypothetical protein
MDKINEEKFYTPKSNIEIKRELIKSIEEFVECGNKFKEWSEQFTFRLAVMSDGLKKYFKEEIL